VEHFGLLRRTSFETSVVLNLNVEPVRTLNEEIP
jgi:hypothetical protein